MPTLQLPSNPALRLLLLSSVGLSSFLVLQWRREAARQRELTHISPSPLDSLLPCLSKEEIEDLPYPPDVLPGARDVDTPYGSIRVYEWGPEDGRKVLMVHGISTPCISLAGVARHLVEKGYRVMLFDLFGRGYSSNPPIHLPHDSMLYTSQILLCLASSSLAWTGQNGFSLIGYSLGGGIAASFTSYFPSLVRSLILIAPSGILRETHITRQSKLLYRTEGILPEWFVEWMVKGRLRAGPMASNRPVHWNQKDERKEIGRHPPLSAGDAAERDIRGYSSPQQNGREELAKGAERRKRTASVTHDQNSPLFANRPNITVPGSVQWQLHNHAGFIRAFISGIRYAPITKCHSTFALIGSRLTRQKLRPDDPEVQAQGLEKGKVLVLLGNDDQIIIRREIEPDLQECLGRENVRVVGVEAAHEVPITRAREIVDVVRDFWEDDDGLS